MAQSNSIESAVERLDLSAAAVSAFAQIISQTSFHQAGTIDAMVSVFCYLGDRIDDDRESLQVAQTANCHEVLALREVPHG